MQQQQQPEQAVRQLPGVESLQQGRGRLEVAAEEQPLLLEQQEQPRERKEEAVLPRQLWLVQEGGVAETPMVLLQRVRGEGRQIRPVPVPEADRPTPWFSRDTEEAVSFLTTSSFPGFWTPRVSPGVLVPGAGSKGQGPTAGQPCLLPPHGRNCIVWKRASGPEGRAAGCHRIPIFLTPPRVRYLLPPKSEHILQLINTSNSEPGQTLRREPQR